MAINVTIAVNDDEDNATLVNDDELLHFRAYSVYLSCHAINYQWICFYSHLRAIFSLLDRLTV